MKSRHKCNANLYTKYLESTVCKFDCSSLSEVSPLEISHDSVSSWLASVKIQPKVIWKACMTDMKNLNMVKEGYSIIADETVISKKHSKKNKLLNFQYSGNEHGVVNGIGMLNLVVSNNTNTLPLDFKIYSPAEEKVSKNEQFRQMLSTAKQRGFTPDNIQADAWYGSLKNLKHIRFLEWDFIIGVASNRHFSDIDKINKKINEFDIPKEGRKLHLKGYGFVLVFMREQKHGSNKYYVVSNLNTTKDQFEHYVERRWEIEVYHKKLKQNFGLEKCQAHKSRSQRNHIALCVVAFMEQTRKLNILNSLNPESIKTTIEKVKWDYVKPVIAKNLKEMYLT